MHKINMPAAISLSIACLVSLSTCGVYAESTPEIYINNKSENLYVDTGTKTSTDGKAKYDSANNILTLSNFSGNDIQISNLETTSIKLEGTNTLTLNTTDRNLIPISLNAPNSNITITGSGTLNIQSDTVSGFSASAAAIRAKNINIETATLNISAPVATCISSSSWTVGNGGQGNVTINSGTLNLKCNSSIQAENVTINNGVITAEKNFSSLISASKNFVMRGGKLTLNNGPSLGSGMQFTQNINISGGDLTIHGGQYGLTIDDISGTGGTAGSFKISGGTLTIDNADNGIVVNGKENSFMEFAGGTTKINAKYESAYIVYTNSAHDSRNIVLGQTIFLAPTNLSVKKDVTDYSGVWTEYKYSLTTNNKAAKNVIISDEEQEEQGPEPQSQSSKDEEEQKTGTDIENPNTDSLDHKMIFAIVFMTIGLVAIAIKKIKANNIKKRIRY